MSRAVIIFGYIFGSCAIACLLAYPISLIVDAEFTKIVSRGVLVSAVLLFYPAYKLLNIKSPEYLGFLPGNSSRTLIAAWLIGVVTLLPLTVYFLLCGYRIWEPVTTAGVLAPVGTIVLAIVAGLVVALIEETLFRGLLQTELNAATNAVLAIIFVSFLYASVHFLEAPDFYNQQTPDWSTGFKVFLSSFSQLGQPHIIWDSWLALFTAGVFLSVVRLRTNNIFWCIGIHAGWVAHIKIVKAFSGRDTDAPCNTLTGAYDKYIGELSTAWIIFLLLIWWIARSRNTSIN